MLITDLHVEPIVPDYLVDPDKKESLAALEETLTRRALWETIRDAAHQKNVDLHKFIDSLTKDELTIFNGLAVTRAMEVSAKVMDLAQRVTSSTAYKIMRSNLWRREEAGSFTEYLFKKLDEAQSPKSIEQTVFLLEIIESYETNSEGKRGYARGLFSNKIAYGKMVTSIPDLRRKQYTLVAAQGSISETVREMSHQQDILRRGQSEARLKGADNDELEMFAERIKDLDEQKEELVNNTREEIENLEADFRATTHAAVDLASSDVSRNQIRESIPLVAKMYLQKEGYDPAKISPEYATNNKNEDEKAKPVAFVIQTQGQAVYVFSVKTKFSAMTTRYLKEMFDVHAAELDEGIEMLNSYKNPTKKGSE